MCCTSEYKKYGFYFAGSDTTIPTIKYTPFVKNNGRDKRNEHFEIEDGEFLQELTFCGNNGTEETYNCESDFFKATPLNTMLLDRSITITSVKSVHSNEAKRVDGFERYRNERVEFEYYRRC